MKRTFSRPRREPSTTALSPVHGEKSLYQIARFIRLEDHEALAIRWHMGAYDTAARADLRDLSAAMDATPWVWRLHEADMCAAHIDERGTDE